jgi:hypothetical protein
LAEKKYYAPDRQVPLILNLAPFGPVSAGPSFFHFKKLRQIGGFSWGNKTLRPLLKGVPKGVFGT